MLKLTHFSTLVVSLLISHSVLAGEFLVESDAVRISDNITVYEGNVSLRISDSVLDVVSDSYERRGSTHRFSGAVKIELASIVIESDDLSLNDGNGAVHISSNRLYVIEVSGS